MTHSNRVPDDSRTLKVQQLFMAHQQGLLAYTLSLVPNFQDAQDIMQEVFIVVTRKADTWTDGTNFFAWACAIARFEVLNHSRSGKRRVVPLDEDVLELLMSDDSHIDDLQSKIERLKDCLKRLAPRARELVMLRYHASQMPEAIAASLSWSVNAVRVALTRAKRVLRDCMNDQKLMEDRS